MASGDGVVRQYLEKLVCDDTAPPPLRLKAAIALDKIDEREAAERRRDDAFPILKSPGHE